MEIWGRQIFGFLAGDEAGDCVCLFGVVRERFSEISAISLYRGGLVCAPLLFPAIHVNTIDAPLSLIWMRAICRSMELK